MNVWDRLNALPDVDAPRRARFAVLVALYEDGGGAVRMILTLRPADMRTHPGDVVFPGGRMEDGEGPIDAATREACEEIGLPREAISGVIGGLSPVTTRYVTRLIVPIVARIERPDELVPDPAEVAAIIEPPVTDLLDERRWRTERWMGNRLWFYDFPEGTLWGATAFMVRELLSYLR